MSKRFRQAIHIGRNITDIMALPCVMQCRKVDLEPIKVIYHLFGNTQARHLRWGDTAIAHEGDWLCEDYAGRWHLLTDDDYQKTVKED